MKQIIHSGKSTVAVVLILLVATSFMVRVMGTVAHCDNVAAKAGNVNKTTNNCGGDCLGFCFTTVEPDYDECVGNDPEKACDPQMVAKDGKTFRFSPCDTIIMRWEGPDGEISEEWRKDWTPVFLCNCPDPGGAVHHGAVHHKWAMQVPAHICL